VSLEYPDTKIKDFLFITVIPITAKTIKRFPSYFNTQWLFVRQAYK